MGKGKKFYNKNNRNQPPPPSKKSVVENLEKRFFAEDNPDNKFLFAIESCSPHYEKFMFLMEIFHSFMKHDHEQYYEGVHHLMLMDLESGSKFIVLEQEWNKSAAPDSCFLKYEPLKDLISEMARGWSLSKEEYEASSLPTWEDLEKNPYGLLAEEKE